MLFSCFGLFFLLVAGVFVLSRRSTLSSVDLLTQDVLVGPAEPVEVEARLLESDSGRPMPFTPIRVRAMARSGSESREVVQEVDSDGLLRLVFPRSDEREEEFRLSLADADDLLLATPWRDDTTTERYVRVEVLVIMPGMDFLLVDLDGLEQSGEIQASPGRLRPPPRSLLEEIGSKLRLHDRVLYIRSGDHRSAQWAKYWLKVTGFPAGPLLIRPEHRPKIAWLKVLAARLRDLGSGVGWTVSGQVDRAAYREVFTESGATVR